MKSFFMGYSGYPHWILCLFKMGGWFQRCFEDDPNVIVQADWNHHVGWRVMRYVVAYAFWSIYLGHTHTTRKDTNILIFYVYNNLLLCCCAMYSTGFYVLQDCTHIQMALPQHKWCSSLQQGMLQKDGEKTKNEPGKSVLTCFLSIQDSAV